jgi:hypothetical protein
MKATLAALDKDDEAALKLNELIRDIIKTLNDLLPKIHNISKEEIGDLVEQEMHKTTDAIEQAVAKLAVKLIYFD